MSQADRTSHDSAGVPRKEPIAGSVPARPQETPPPTYRERCYCEGHVTKPYLAAKLDRGLVCTDVVRNGYSGGDVVYFRAGTPEEIANCRELLAKSEGR